MAAVKRLPLAGLKGIAFDPAAAIVFDGVGETPVHPNTLAFTAFDAVARCSPTSDGARSAAVSWVREAEVGHPVEEGTAVPYPFRSGKDLLVRADEAGLTIAELMMANENAPCARPRMSTATSTASSRR